MTEPPWAGDEALRDVVACLTGADGTVRIAGGAVRDWLLGRPIGDIDLATDLTPEQVQTALRRASLKAVPTGLAHGTITAVARGRPYEVTTLRRDTQTDGRHATVTYTDSWAEDAARRDFTINALYADLEGTIHDPLGQGRADLAAGRLRFAGDPHQRIREDYLRILRLFRFQAQLGLAADPEGLSAAKELRDGLTHLSAERVWQEMRKLLAAPGRLTALQEMARTGVLDIILPEAAAVESLAELQTFEPVAALAALTGGVQPVAARWRLSKAESARLSAALLPLPADTSLANLRRVAWRDGVEAVSDRLHLARRADDAALLQTWTPPPLPVRGADVKALGVPPGPEVGKTLRRLIDWWLARDFAPDRAACLTELERLVAELSRET